MDSENKERGWGGRREGAGRPQQRITLDVQTANVLRELTRLWRLEMPDGDYTPTRLIEHWIYVEAMKRWCEPGDTASHARLIAIERGETPESPQ